MQQRWQWRPGKPAESLCFAWNSWAHLAVHSLAGSEGHAANCASVVAPLQAVSSQSRDGGAVLQGTGTSVLTHCLGGLQRYVAGISTRLLVLVLWTCCSEGLRGCFGDWHKGGCGVAEGLLRCGADYAKIEFLCSCDRDRSPFNKDKPSHQTPNKSMPQYAVTAAPPVVQCSAVQRCCCCLQKMLLKCFLQTSKRLF